MKCEGGCLEYDALEQFVVERYYTLSLASSPGRLVLSSFGSLLWLDFGTFGQLVALSSTAYSCGPDVAFRSVTHYSGSPPVVADRAASLSALASTLRFDKRANSSVGAATMVGCINNDTQLSEAVPCASEGVVDFDELLRDDAMW